MAKCELIKAEKNAFKVLIYDKDYAAVMKLAKCNFICWFVKNTVLHTESRYVIDTVFVRKKCNSFLWF